MKRLLSRRNVLRGAGVALTLPWMESLLPRAARAQAAGLPKRYMPIYLPNGAPEIWRPVSSGSGAAWQLSSVLDRAGLAKRRFIVSNSTVWPLHGEAFANLTDDEPILLPRDARLRVRDRLWIPGLMGSFLDVPRGWDWDEQEWVDDADDG